MVCMAGAAAGPKDDPGLPQLHHLRGRRLRCWPQHFSRLSAGDGSEPLARNIGIGITRHTFSVMQ